MVPHGADDTVVPAAQGEGLASALLAVGADVAFHRVPGADHLGSARPTRTSRNASRPPWRSPRGSRRRPRDDPGMNRPGPVLEKA
ncbi:alpha/beta hydrolase family protein [Streptomyces griseosporeus]|uniref:alpha/beta hydrolase family protein n=1 Tax=Streptomyces griseosporeus TaxID=1910 RepID=UPI0037BA9DDD